MDYVVRNQEKGWGNDRAVSRVAPTARLRLWLFVQKPTSMGVFLQPSPATHFQVLRQLCQNVHGDPGL